MNQKYTLSETSFSAIFTRVLYKLPDYDVKQNMVVKPETLVHEDLNMDSLDVVGLLDALERKYDIKMLDDSYSKMRTVNDFYKKFIIAMNNRNIKK